MEISPGHATRCFHISPTVLRTFWMEEFLYGKKSLNWYEPGVYDLNLKSNTLTKISVNFPNLNQFDGFYLVDPGSA